MFTNSHTHFSLHKDTEILQVPFDVIVDHPHSIGIHPWEADKFNISQAEELLKNNSTSTTIAIGECGLDKLNGPELSLQQAIFEQHIRFSETHQFPLIIHCVKAWNELLVMRKSFQPKQPWVFHGFMKANIIDSVVESQMMISIGAGILHHPQAIKIINQIPSHQLLIETDMIEMEIKDIYTFIADIKKISLQELNNQVTRNFKNTFTKWQIG